MHLVNVLPIFINLKKDNHDFILIIIDWLTKIVYYKPVKIIINSLGLAQVIIDFVIWHHKLLNLIMTNKSSLFTSKIRLLLCYFFGIKQQLSTTFRL